MRRRAFGTQPHGRAGGLTSCPGARAKRVTLCLAHSLFVRAHDVYVAPIGTFIFLDALISPAVEVTADGGPPWPAVSRDIGSGEHASLPALAFLCPPLCDAFVCSDHDVVTAGALHEFDTVRCPSVSHCASQGDGFAISQADFRCSASQTKHGSLDALAPHRPRKPDTRSDLQSPAAPIVLETLVAPPGLGTWSIAPEASVCMERSLDPTSEAPKAPMNSQIVLHRTDNSMQAPMHAAVDESRCTSYTDDSLQSSTDAQSCPIRTDDPKHAHADPQRCPYRSDNPSPSADSRSSLGIGMVACACFETWVKHVTTCNTHFSRFAAAFVSKSASTRKGRHRDALPLPVPEFADFQLTVVLGPREMNAVLTFVRLSCAGLNWVFAGERRCEVPATCTKIHRKVFTTIATKVLCLGRLLDESPGLLDDAAARESSPGEKGPCPHPPLQADLVDFLEVSGGVNPLSFLPGSIAELLKSPDKLFPHLAGDCAAAKVSARDKIEYARLTVKGLRSGKLDLSLTIQCNGESFAVSKRGGQRQREVWHGGRISELALAPPHPPLLANPAALGELCGSDDVPLAASSRDCMVFFDQLRSPIELRPYFGKPPLEAGDLSDEILGEGNGMGLAELQGFLPPGSVIRDDTVLHPRCAAFPMGFSWSSFIAQSVSTKCVMEIPVGPDRFLVEQGVQPSVGPPCFSVATDDTFCFERLADDQLLGTMSAEMGLLDEIFARRNILIQETKSLNRQRNCTVLGIELRDGLWLGPKGARVKSLWSCIMSWKLGDVVPVKLLESIVGSLNWHNLLARGLLSCIHRCYGAIKEPQAQAHVVMTAPLLTELMVNSCLAAFWVVDLRRPWTTLVPFSDASEAFGYGLCFGRLRDPDVPTVANRLASWPHHATFANTAPGSGHAKRAGKAVRLSCRDDQCRVVFGIRARSKGPAGKLEARAVSLGLQRVLRSTGQHGCRMLFGVDAQAVMHALNKGRSSAWSIRREIARSAAVCLAGDLRCKFFYIQSELNVADAPSRGKFTRTQRTNRVAHRHPLHSSSYNRLRRHLVRSGMWSRSSDDSRRWSCRNTENSSEMSGR